MPILGAGGSMVYRLDGTTAEVHARVTGVKTATQIFVESAEQRPDDAVVIE